ncbi:ABC transporter permease [Konateibacter massiliensis]|uniref:ABC transporter permease n=1 Tax=Konateibacter massiliensis TaxID=2002841 RepID=UPI000C14C811|nr:ABC transporter permease [Konateibacter massiliensis]
MRIVKKLVNYGVITWIGIFLLWQFAALMNNPDFFPGPVATLKGVAELSKDGSLFYYMGVSLWRVMRGWLLGSIIAIPTGLLLGRVVSLRKLIEPFLHFIRFIPPLALITLFMLWFGIGEASKTALITYSTLFTVIINTMAGVAAIKEDRLRSARCMGASEIQIMQHVIIPSSIPYIFTGIRLAMGSSFMAIIGAEMISANEGIGYMIWSSRLYFKTDWIFVGLFCLGIMGFLADFILVRVGKQIWYRYGIGRPV